MNEDLTGQQFGMVKVDAMNPASMQPNCVAVSCVKCGTSWYETNIERLKSGAVVCKSVACVYPHIKGAA